MSTLTERLQDAPSSRLKRLIISHPLVAYFVIAFAGSWLVELPLLLARNGFGLLPFTFPGFVPLLFFIGPGAFAGPTLAAFLVTATTSGKVGVRHLLRRYVQWRVGLRWYLLALFSFLLVFLLSVSLSLGASPFLTLLGQWPLLFSLFLPFVLTLGLLDGLGEEPGWRGFALPRLQQRFGPVRGTFLLGTLHGLWHLPAFFVVGDPLYPFTVPSFVTFVLTAMAGTFIYTWIYNHAQGSILIAILIHAASNAASGLVNQLVPTNPALSGLARVIYYDNWNNVIAFGVVALLLILFTRGRLGYQPTRNAQLGEAPHPANALSSHAQ
jgi:membrane protease YdiL (CAAX protease family)